MKLLMTDDKLYFITVALIAFGSVIFKCFTYVCEKVRFKNSYF